MFTRRKFLHTGMGAAAVGLLGKYGWSLERRKTDACSPANALPVADTSPFHSIETHPKSMIVDGMPFADGFTGDSFAASEIPFHTCENCFANGTPPAPTDEVDVVVVGGGISGLSTAYLLREQNPVLFELRSRFGGVAQGEYWNGTPYSLGNAYVITPDEGCFLDDIYRQLGLREVVRVNDEDDIIEVASKILTDFWTGSASPPDEAAAYKRYAEVVNQMADKDYPDIPLPKGKDNQWILDLDNVSFEQDIKTQMKVPVPNLLAAAIQAYCHSSFAGGWEEISAAGGWNFLAAEEYGRWVFPGGTTYMVHQFWRKLTELDARRRPSCRPYHLRAGCTVVDVRLAADDKVQVTYADSDGQFRSLLAKRVVMCCPKMIAKYLIHDLEKIDESKLNAMHRLEYRSYLVANVLLNKPLKLDFYDIFLLKDGVFSMNEGEAELYSRVADMLAGHYARPESLPRSVLTLYWPLSYPYARFALLDKNSWQNFAEQLVPQIKSMLSLLDVPDDAIEQVRMTRWGHAMPLHRVGQIANGTVDHLRRPFEDRIYFVNQDNWALPAVENCLLDAEIYVPQVAAAL